MSLRFRLKSPAGALVVATALTFAVGCQVVAPARLAVLQTSPGQVSANAGLVSVDLAVVTRAWNSARRVQQIAGAPLPGSPEFRVERVRLRVEGPGLPDDLAAEADYNESPVEVELRLLTSLKMIPGLSLVVPAGPNRLFTLEGLNCNGKVVHRLRSLSAVSGGQSLNLKMNYLTDAAGRTLGHLLAGSSGDKGDATGVAASLKISDLTAALTAHIQRITGYNEADNTYTGSVGPESFRSADLANELFGRGIGQLTPEATAGIQYREPVGATVQFTVMDGAVGSAYANVVLNDVSGEKRYATFVDGTGSFSGVTPGVWTIMASKGGKYAWGTVETRDSATVAIKLSLTSGDYKPCAAPDPMPGAEGLIYTNGVEPGWEIGGNGSVVSSLDLAAAGPGGLGTAIKLLMPIGGRLNISETRVVPLDKTVFSHLKFSAKSGLAGQQFFIKATASGFAAPSPVVITPPVASYQGYDVPLMAFGLSPLPAGSWQFDIVPDPAGSGAAELHLDDLKLEPMAP